MPARRRRPREPEEFPGGTLDWSASHHVAYDPLPCRYCGRPTHLRDSRGRAADKVCAEEALARQAAEASEAYRVQGRL